LIELHRSDEPGELLRAIARERLEAIDLEVRIALRIDLADRGRLRADDERRRPRPLAVDHVVRLLLLVERDAKRSDVGADHADDDRDVVVFDRARVRGLREECEGDRRRREDCLHDRATRATWSIFHWKPR